MERLTERQSEIVAAVCDELTNDGVARRYSISPHSVKNHMTAIFRRLGVQSRAGLCYRYGQATERQAMTDGFRAEQV